MTLPLFVEGLIFRKSLGTSLVTQSPGIDLEIIMLAIESSSNQNKVIDLNDETHLLDQNSNVERNGLIASPLMLFVIVHRVQEHQR